MSDFNKFRNKTIKEIRLWAWAAAVLPITALSGIFFIWVFGSDTIFKRAMVVGETTMFGVAVVWWWWAIYVINRIIRHWDNTRAQMSEVLDEIKEVRTIVTDVIRNNSDK